MASEGRVGTAILALVAAAAMLLRTARSLICLLVTVSLVLLAHVPGSGLTLTAALVVGCLLALASVGRHCSDAVSIASVLGTVTVFVVGSAFTGRPWDVVVALIACGAAWTAGRMLRRESQQNAQLSALATELVAQREIQQLEAVQGERIRIARELHDTVAHTVSVMTLQVGGVRRRLDRDPTSRAERDVLFDVEGLGREAVAELRRILGVLRSPDEDESGESGRGVSPQPRLADLDELAARVRAAGVPVELRVEGTARQLPAGLELAGYRVVQEALTNVLKHSPGATARVQVAYTDESLELLVQDNGRAANVAAAEGTGLGLTGIRERVALYGGHAETGATDTGFRVRATLPVAAANRR
ncbi:MAG: sensor histidine kinase [Thermocrispum sp.]